MTEPAATWTFTAAGEVAERLEFLTDVLPAVTGPEQRRRLRDAPRIALSFDCQEEGRAARQLEVVLARNGAGLWRVPLVQDSSPLLTPWPAGTLSLTLDLDARWCRYKVGGYALVMGNDARVYDVLEITAVDSYSIEVAAQGDHDWPAGVWVCPLVTARLPSVPAMARFTGGQVAGQVTFELAEPLDETRDAGAATYRGYPVVELRPDWSRDPETSHDRAVAYEDNEIGFPVAYDQAGQVLGRTVFQVAMADRQEIAQLRGLLYALGGRWATCWVPSQAADFLVTAPLVSGASTLDVEWAGFSEWSIAPWRRDVRIQLVDGTVLYRRITAAVALGADQERLTLGSALGVSVAADQVALVSYLTLARQDTDVASLKYWVKGLVQTELSFRGTAANDV